MITPDTTWLTYWYQSEIPWLTTLWATFAAQRQYRKRDMAVAKKPTRRFSTPGRWKFSCADQTVRRRRVFRQGDDAFVAPVGR